jgi:biopolymer transport protein ExbB
MIDYFLKGGVLMWPILGCSVAALALILTKAVQLQLALKRLSAGAHRVLERPPAEIAPVVQAVRSGANEKQVAFLGTQQIRELERGLGVLGLIASIAPLLGFTGTVTGMIQAFMAIANHTGGRVEPAMVAGGIYEALLTTAAGLFVAIPTHVALHFLEERLDGVTLRMRDIALTLLEDRRNGV